MVKAIEMAGTETSHPFARAKVTTPFESIYRFVWDIIAGFNIWEPNLFEVHFSSVSIPKPGGVISA